MGQRIYYHNITKNEYNINDLQDAVEQADKNDIIKFSERGCAIMFDIRNEMKEEYSDYKEVRTHFYEYFKEFHEENFDIENEFCKCDPNRNLDTSTYLVCKKCDKKL